MDRSARTLAPLTILAIVTALAAGCSSRTPVSVSEMVNHARCEQTKPGVAIIDFEQMATIRGSRLIGGSLQSVKNVPDTQLAVISKGPQPSPGYSFKLDYAYQTGDELIVEVSWFEPPTNELQAQVVTEPCLVVAFPMKTAKGPIRRVRAIDVQTDGVIGETDVPARPS